MTTDTATTHRALCVALPSEGGAPEWVMLLPAGPAIEGNDGRAWTMADPAVVVTASRALNRDLVFDWEHGAELRGRNGERAPASGWIKELDVRDGAIWGRVAWTPEGRADVEGGAYRYVSPVFDHTKDRRIVRLVGASLVHYPNLGSLPALNSERTDMTIPASLTKALGLVDGASEDQCLGAIDALKGDLKRATNAAESPDLERFVPRSEYDQAVARATNAEAKVTEIEGKAHADAVDQAIAEALEGGKIAPANEPFYRSVCSDAAGLEKFRAFAAAAPTVIGDGLAGKEPPGKGKANALTDEERAVCRQLDLPEDDFRSAKGGDA